MLSSTNHIHASKWTDKQTQTGVIHADMSLSQLDTDSDMTIPVQE